MKIECYVKIDKEDLPCLQKVKLLGKKERSIWRNEANIDLKETFFYYEYTENGSAGKKPVSFYKIQMRSHIQPESLNWYVGNRAGGSNILKISDFVDTFNTYDDGLNDGVIRCITLPQHRHYTYSFSCQNQHQNDNTIQLPQADSSYKAEGFCSRFCKALENFVIGIWVFMIIL